VETRSYGLSIVFYGLNRLADRCRDFVVVMYFDNIVQRRIAVSQRSRLAGQVKTPAAATLMRVRKIGLADLLRWV